VKGWRENQQRGSKFNLASVRPSGTRFLSMELRHD
jgi:hypothetical protein